MGVSQPIPTNQKLAKAEHKLDFGIVLSELIGVDQQVYDPPKISLSGKFFPSEDQREIELAQVEEAPQLVSMEIEAEVGLPLLADEKEKPSPHDETLEKESTHQVDGTAYLQGYQAGELPVVQPKVQPESEIIIQPTTMLPAGNHKGETPISFAEDSFGEIQQQPIETANFVLPGPEPAMAPLSKSTKEDSILTKFAVPSSSSLDGLTEMPEMVDQIPKEAQPELVFEQPKIEQESRNLVRVAPQVASDQPTPNKYLANPDSISPDSTPITDTVLGERRAMPALQAETQQINHFVENSSEVNQEQSVAKVVSSIDSTQQVDLVESDAVDDSLLAPPEKALLQLDTDQPVTTEPETEPGIQVNALQTPQLNSVEQPEAVSPSQPVFEPEDVISQIVEKMQVHTGEERSEVIIQLKPDYLGDVRIKLVVEHGVVTAEFVADSQVVREIIGANLPQLRSNLQEMGLNLHQVSVNVGSDSFNQDAQSARERLLSNENKKRTGTSSRSRSSGVTRESKAASRYYQPLGNIDFQA